MAPPHDLTLHTGLHRPEWEHSIALHPRDGEKTKGLGNPRPLRIEHEVNFNI